MAVRRKATRRRRAATNPRPRRRRRGVVVSNHRRYTANRLVNRRRRVNRRRNPNIKAMFVGALWAAGGSMAQSLISSVIPIRGEGWMGLGIQWGVAYLTSYIGERIIPGGNAYAFSLGAAAGAAKATLDMVLGLVGGPITGALAGPGAMQVGQPQQQALPAAPMGDIVAAPDFYTGFADVVDAPDYY